MRGMGVWSRGKLRLPQAAPLGRPAPPAAAQGSGLITDDVRTPPPPGPIREMNEAEYRRFVNHMLWLVIDEAEPLRDLGSHMLEQDMTTETTWGPWPPEDCARLLLRWFDAGLVSLHNEETAFPEGEARGFLATPTRWRAEGGAFEPYIAATDRGAQTPDAEWFALVADLRLPPTLAPAETTDDK